MQVFRIFTKHIVLEDTALSKAFIESRPVPKIDMQVHVNHETKPDSTIEAVLTLQLVAKHEEKVLWRLQLQEAGLFSLDGFAPDMIQPVINGFCMNMIYPYACEAISEIVVRGGFEPVYLAPMNFELLYQEQQKKIHELKDKNKGNN